MYIKTMLRAAVLLGLVAAMPLLSACHTMSGAGQDITKTGQTLDNAAQKATP